MTETAFKSATELAAMIRQRDIGAEELLDLYFARIDEHNPALNAVIWQDRETARETARAADSATARGGDLPPLHGVPMTIKESYDLAGSPTTWGDPEFRDNIAETDSVSVQRLKAAGVNLFGKTNVPLMLADWQSYNDIYGVTN
ncbi:MAG: amidase family protein, partial [Alphaproteobacteria bacterium]|nr:amidase family protein [Alphaproteobacteria bacterium]